MIPNRQAAPIEAIYIHIPFCSRKCHYCDFLSDSQPKAMAPYIQALAQEMTLVCQQYAVAPRTIFLGGGTPTILPAPLLEQLLQAVASHFVTAALEEYTIEANPGTLTPEKTALMAQYGVNRLSMGVQSDDPALLQRLGRIHTFDQAVEGLTMARAAGITNINLDFMYGLPGQTAEQWRASLAHILTLKPQHLSLYQLKIEDGTQFALWLEEGVIEEFDDEIALEMYRDGQRMLAEAGYRQYEISNYAKPGYESRHNQVYWQTQSYLGLGLGACSWVAPNRWNNTDSMEDYLHRIAAGQLPALEPEVLTQQEQMEEMVFMALRMNQGLSRQAFRQRFGLAVEEVFAQALDKCQQQGWITQTEDTIALTQQGRVVGNLVFVEFIL